MTTQDAAKSKRIELWGTFSVKDHLRERAFVAEVLLYDRLVIPRPPTNSWLTLASPLDPFKKTENGKERAYTSFDCINIERQLGYTYGPGSLEQPAELMAALPAAVANLRTVIVTGINRARVRGSFLITLERRRY
jgi:hypothetical protein